MDDLPEDIWSTLRDEYLGDLELSVLSMTCTWMDRSIQRACIWRLLTVPQMIKRAAMRGYLELVRSFLNRRYGGEQEHLQQQLTAKTKQSVHYYACYSGSLALVRLLEEDCGFRPDRKESCIMTARSGHADILDYLLERHGAALEHRLHSSLLIISAGTGNLECVKVVKKRLEVDISFGVRCQMAARSGNIDLMKHVTKRIDPVLFVLLVLRHVLAFGHFEMIHYLNARLNFRSLLVLWHPPPSMEYLYDCYMNGTARTVPRRGKQCIDWHDLYRLFINAAAGGSVACFRQMCTWFPEMPLSTVFYGRAAAHGNIALLRWLDEQKCPVDAQLIYEGALRDWRGEVLRYLYDDRKLPYPNGMQTCLCHVISRSKTDVIPADCLAFILDRGHTIEEDDWYIFIDFNAYDRIAVLLDRFPKREQHPADLMLTAVCLGQVRIVDLLRRHGWPLPNPLEDDWGELTPRMTRYIELYSIHT